MGKQEKKEYYKPPKTIKEQIELLKARGLIINNEEKIKYYLTNISYYHWSIYFKHFQKDNKFLNEICFDDVLKLYIFDNRLRLLILEVLERIEKSFKCRMAYELSILTNDSHYYLKNDLYVNQNSCNEVKKIIKAEMSKSSEICISHYKNNYYTPEMPPIWTVVEILSFGQCLKICGLFKREYKNKIARTLGEDESFIMNWMHCLAHLRNKCAHHIRLWNSNLIILPKMKHRRYKNKFNYNKDMKKRIFNYLVILQIILQKINPTSNWLERFDELISEFEINPYYMGFPVNWKSILNNFSIKEGENNFKNF